MTRISTTILGQAARSLRPGLIALVCAFALAAGGAGAATLTWTGALSSDWNKTNNWSPSQVPTATDHVIITNGSVAVPANAAFAIIDWTGGAVTGPLTVPSNAVLNILGTTDLYPSVITNAGTVVWSGASVLWAYSNPFYNLAGGLVEIHNDMTFHGSEAFNNAGVVRKVAGSGTTGFSVPFNNSGSVEAQTGTITFQDTYSNAPSATLAVSLGGPVPGTNYGRISFTRPLDFAGAFTVNPVNAYRPPPSTSFQVLSYPSVTNLFPCLNGLDLGAGLLLQPQFTRGGMALTAVAYTPGPKPELFISRAPSGVLVIWPASFSGWALASCGDLNIPNWVPVAATCTNTAFLPGASPALFFRLRNGN